MTGESIGPGIWEYREDEAPGKIPSGTSREKRGLPKTPEEEDPEKRIGDPERHGG